MIHGNPDAARRLRPWRSEPTARHPRGILDGVGFIPPPLEEKNFTIAITDWVESQGFSIQTKRDTPPMPYAQRLKTFLG